MTLLDGMPLTLPAFLRLGAPVTLPCVLQSSDLALSFDLDPEVGPILTHLAASSLTTSEPGLSTVPAGDSGPFRALQPAHDPSGERNHGLWELHMRLQYVDDTVVRVDPRNATRGHEVHHVVADEDTPGLLFVWSGIAVPDARDADRLFVVQLVTLRSGDRGAKWLTWVGREAGGESASIEFVDSPRITVIGPVDPEPGESHLAAQKRARVMVPASTNFALHVGSDAPTRLAFSESSAPLYFWATSAATNSLLHPNQQQQQFSALYATDSRDAKSFRHVLYLATEDDEGYAKVFHHEGFAQAVDWGGGAGQQIEETLGCYRWSARYIPGYEDVLGVDADAEPVRTQFGNTYQTPYPAVTGVLVAKTDDVWFDVAERYRDFVRGSRMWGKPIAERADRSALDHGASWLAMIDRRDSPKGRQADQANLLGAPMYRDFFDVARTLQIGLRSPGLSEQRCFVHWQSIRRDGYSARTVDAPIVESIDYGAESINRMGQEYGISTSVYVLPSGIILESQPNFLRVFPPEFVAYDRSGEPSVDPQFLPVSFELPEGLDPYVRPVDYGTPGARRWFFDNVYRPLIVEYGFRGFYTDVFAGGGIHLYYDPPAPLRPGHVAHGGKHAVTGKQALLDMIRELVCELGTKAGDPESYIGVGEGAEEYIQDRYDLSNCGYLLHGHQLMLAEPSLTALLGESDGFEGVPVLARQMNPPLWNAVHHEWAPAQRQNTAFNNIGLATHRRFRQRSTGLTPDEMLDIHSFIMTLVLTEGGQPASFIYFRDLESPLCILGDDGETLVVDRTADPSGVGLRVMALARHLHGYVNRAMGPYVLRGRMERPLQQAHLDHQLELWSRSNPVALLNPVLGRVSPEQVGSVGPVLYGRPPYFAGLLDYPVLGVIHSVWRSVTGGLGIVVSNWTGDAGGFSAVFDPELYGLLPDTLFRFRFVGEDPEISRISEVFRGRVMMTTDAAADDMPAFELDHLVPRQAALFELVVES